MLDTSKRASFADGLNTGKVGLFYHIALFSMPIGRDRWVFCCLFSEVDCSNVPAIFATFTIFPDLLYAAFGVGTAYKMCYFSLAIAQRIEQWCPKPFVPGSTPGGGAKVFTAVEYPRQK